MNPARPELEDELLPPALDVHGPGHLLAASLLEEKLIRYTDDRFQTSSGECRFILKLVPQGEKFVLFYAQVPFIYPIPDELKASIHASLEALVKKPLEIEFINAGTKAQKQAIQQTASFLGE